jgi:hypothetical protein
MYRFPSRRDQTFIEPRTPKNFEAPEERNISFKTRTLRSSGAQEFLTTEL